MIPPQKAQDGIHYKSEKFGKNNSYPEEVPGVHSLNFQHHPFEHNHPLFHFRCEKNCAHQPE